MDGSAGVIGIQAQVFVLNIDSISLTELSSQPLVWSFFFFKDRFSLFSHDWPGALTTG